MRFGQLGVLLGRVEAAGEEIGQVGGLEDRLVDVSLVEQVMNERVRAIVLELLERPLPFLGAEVGVVVVEALDEALAVLVAVVGTRGPVVDVGIDDEVTVAAAAGSAACSGGDQRGLRAVTHAELAQDVADMGLDGLLRHGQHVGDLAVVEAVADQFQDLELTRGEIVDG